MEMGSLVEVTVELTHRAYTELLNKQVLPRNTTFPSLYSKVMGRVFTRLQMRLIGVINIQEHSHIWTGLHNPQI